MAKQVKKSQYRIELEKEVKPMLQEANMKLLMIEKLAEQKEFAGVEGYAYRNALQTIQEIRGKEFKRFNMPKNTHQLEKTKRALEKFLASPSSTRAGIEQVYQKNADFLNEQFGSDKSWQNMATFLEAAAFEDLKDNYTSTLALKVVKAMYVHKNLRKKDFIEMLEKHQIEDIDEVDSDTLASFVGKNVKWTQVKKRDK